MFEATLQKTLKNKQVVAIRGAVRGDARQLASILQQIAGESSFVNTTGSDYQFTLPETRVYIKKMRKLNHSFLLVAVLNDSLVASLACQGDGRQKMKHAATIGMGVLKQYWGLSIGSKLLGVAIERARQMGLRKLNLSVRCDNEGAIALYKKFGFLNEGRQSRFHRLGEEFKDALLMGLQLD